MLLKTCFGFALAGALLAGCLGDIGDGPAAGPTPVRPVPTTAPLPDGVTAPVTVPVVAGDPHGGVLRPPDPPPEVEPRSRRRMDLDQLDAAIRQVSGGIGWTEQRGNTQVNLFVELSATLGKPDFVQRTEEDLVPGAMFQKFLDDAARSVCQELVRQDVDRPRDQRTFFLEAAPEDTLTMEPEAVKKNLQALLLRFHGQRLADGDARLEPWTWLFQRAEHTGVAPALAWRAVCVALITHPDFYTY